MQHATQSYARNQTAILMIAIAAALVAGAASAASSNQFLLLNYSPSGSFSPSGSDSANVMGYVAGKFGAANHASELKVGVSCLYIPGWNSSASELALMTNDLAQAELLGIPILVQVDTETWLPTSLLNWYDSGLPGYDTNKVADVEWYGWDSTNAIKLSWRNWGSPFRIGPTPNFLSTNFQAYEKSIYDVFIPKVLQWYANLPANKKWLFVGWKCGWESAINSNYRFFPDGNSYYGTSSNPSWSDSYQPLGYNAAKTAGIRTNGIVTTDDNARIVGRHLAYLAKLAVDAGIPRDKVSVHGTTYGTYQQDMDALVNSNGNPGASWYGGDSLKSNTAFSQAVQTAKASYGATGYGYGEFNLFTSDYNTWYSWLQNTLHGDPDCVYQALYNFDTMKDVSSVEQAMLDAMALYPVPPLSVVLDRPTDYGMFMVGSSVPATATVANGTLPYTVAFYTNCAGGAYWQAGTTNASPYTVNLGALALGTYGIYATVTDGTNGAAISATNTFTVQVAPSDNAGSGGTITYTDSNGLNPRSSPPYTDGYVVHTFTNAGTSMLTLPIAVTGSVMVVAGGGGGGWNCGGGGGAGGLIYYGAETSANGHAEGTNFFITAGSSAVTIGSGGTAGADGNSHGGSGGDSRFGASLAFGGGGGAGRDAGFGNNITGGSPGGSGGGGSGACFQDYVQYGGAGTNGQGAAGGNGTTDYGLDSAGGGGGGAGAAGATGTKSSPGGNGGVGLEYFISGTPTYYAGGGAGLGYQVDGAVGGLGGGGNQSQAAAANTGGGGGGGNAGAGGSGIVIIKYPYVSFLSGYTAWAAVITNGLTNATDCAAGDGYPNLLKYATGSSPTNSDTRARVGGVMSNGLFWIRFYRNTNASDVTVSIETKTNLMDASWIGVATNVHNSGWLPSNLVDERGVGVTNPVSTSVKDDSDSPQRFMRLRVTRP